MAKKIGDSGAAPNQAATDEPSAAEAAAPGAAAAFTRLLTGPAAGFEKTQAEVKTNMEKAMKTAEDLVAFGQGNVEALVKSGQIWAAGVQDLTKTVAATAQSQLDETMAVVKALAGVKSPKDALDLQTNLARSFMEKMMAETGKLTETSMKLAEQAWAPLTARMNLAVETFGRAA